ncbi:MAG TPA: hypothetical protein VN937_13795 [Blastocatellia bacterium]|nr:hypothetical protein [Blastocatellia bacterium]
MALSETDPTPDKITLREAYNKIRPWYQNNKDKCKAQDASYAQKSFALIDNLPNVEKLSDLEVRAVLGEVIYGNLEWAYHQSDGEYKMAAYAHAALEQAGFQFSLDERERDGLRHSILWPYLSINGSA